MVGCKCGGICNDKHCPCQKDNLSCGDGCGCSSDKCMNRIKRPDIRGFFLPPSKKQKVSSPLISESSNNIEDEVNINCSTSTEGTSQDTSNKKNDTSLSCPSNHKEYSIDIEDGDNKGCRVYEHRSCNDKQRSSVTRELGHNISLKIDADDACPKYQHDKLLSSNNNNNNNINNTKQLINTSSRLAIALPVPPAIPTSIDNNEKSTQDVHQNYNFPFEPPTPRKEMAEVYGEQYWPSETNNHYGLDTFCYDDGRCSCGSSNMMCHKNRKTIKVILCNGRPRFVQSISLKCQTCNKTTMAFDKSYIDTLSPEKKRQLNAIIVGRADGIDMGLIRSLRNGISAEEVEQTACANFYEEWSASKRQYEASNSTGQDFPPFPKEYVPKAAQLTNAFLRDAESERLWLKRELAALKSSTALSIDCQVKVVQRCVKKGDGMGSAQALSILGDTGILLSHVVVPSDKKEYRTQAMEEVVSRHDELPKFCYVDRDCCNGKPGGRTEETKMYHGMEKKLDSKHLLTRITDTINPEHKRASTFARELSDSIFTPNIHDKNRLGSAIGRLLTSGEEKCEHVRRHIGFGKTICSSIVSKVVNQATIDKHNKTKYDSTYSSTETLTPSHWAYPLITTLVWKAIKQQLIHIANGCLSDDGEDMNIILRQKSYKKTKVMLPVYISTRGTSKNESFHSFISTKSKEWRQIRPEIYDARVLWIVVHYNRQKLRKAGKQVLPNGISPSEAAPNEVVLAKIEDGEKIKFGFEYFNSVKSMKVQGIIKKKEHIPTIVKSSTRNNDYTLLESINVPEEVGVEEVRRIGEVLEQALPASGDSPKQEDMQLPPNIIEKCTESLNESKQQLSKPQPIFSPIGMEIDDDTFTRSTASTLTAGSISKLPFLDMSGDTDLLCRQEAARDTMIKNNISLDRDAKIPGERSNNCSICFKNRRLFTFQGRKHKQINKKEKRAKVRWYCPLADPIEQYYALLEKRDSLRARRYERYAQSKRRKDGV